MSSLPLCVLAAFDLSIHPLVDTWALSTSCLCDNAALNMGMQMSLFSHVCSQCFGCAERRLESSQSCTGSMHYQRISEAWLSSLPLPLISGGKVYRWPDVKESPRFIAKPSLGPIDGAPPGSVRGPGATTRRVRPPPHIALGQVPGGAVGEAC